MNLVQHNAVSMQSMHIGFALNLHCAIRLLNWFESGFSVNCRPLEVFSGSDDVVTVVKIRLLMDPMPVQKIALMLPNEP